MKIYYKILCGYDAERSVEITEDELEKAYGIFLLGGRAIFSGGAVDGKNIQMIVPDWHKTMGWKTGYRLTPDDYAELSERGIDRRARELQRGMHVRVSHLISQGKQNLIGTGVHLPELEQKTGTRRYDGPKSIGEIKTP